MRNYFRRTFVFSDDCWISDSPSTSPCIRDDLQNSVEETSNLLRFNHCCGVESNPLARRKDGGAGVRCPVKSDYESISITPLQAGQIWSRLPMAESTLTLLAASTGLRVSECLGLQWGDIDFEGQVIKVRRSWSGGRIGRTKTVWRQGNVPVNDNQNSRLSLELLSSSPLCR